jgi:hypothetical protein
LYFHHSEGWTENLARARAPFPLIKEHVLLRRAGLLAEVDGPLAALLTADVIERIVGLIPEAWLEDGPSHRSAYARYLIERLAAPRPFAEEALRAR